MVDAIVSYAVEKLGDFLIREAAFLHEVKNEVVRLQNELRWMRSFLKDAEQKQDGDERIRVWVSEIQDIAYDTQDVIETFIVLKMPIRTSKQGMLIISVKNCFGISAKADLYSIGKEIKALKNRVLEVSRNREIYGINNIGSLQEGTNSGASILRDLRLTTSYAEEHMVGFEDDAQFLRAKLFLREPRRSVISIFGMGGLGKTTLARKLYNTTTTQFGGHAWVCVSQEWKTRDLFERLIKSFKKLTKDELEMLEKMRDYDMEQYLRELLKGCRYLVVIDDLWQIEAWESLRRALPDIKNGSRVIITTRKEAVAELSNERTYVHKLRFLRPDESWQLFCKKAFPDNSGVCPPYIEKLGEEIMAKCGGLPLAIIVLGGLLSRKQFHEWHMVKEHIWREIKDGSIYISSLLALSYKDLPHELKSCFLYLGIFPEDSLIDVEKLIQLWIAEEFIPHGEGPDLEEVAENYLKELIGRSLIQVVKRNWRTISTCRMHDLLRDLAVNKAKELNFLQISDESKDSGPSIVVSSYRRIAFRSRIESYMSFCHTRQPVRTLSFLNNEFINTRDFNGVGAERLMLMKLLYTRFSLLRVLDLEGVNVSGEVKLRFFEAVGKLIHLRYLGLNDTRVNELPESIGKLLFLQTLNISGNNNFMLLPTNICKLKQLRHLKGSLVTEKGSLLTTASLFEELTNLQCLKKVDIDGWLRQKEGDEFALNAFAKLRNLKILSVEFYAEYLLSVQPLFNCMHLIELTIYGGIVNPPKEMHKFLPNLKFLRLSGSRFEQDPMPALEMLPNLLVLELDDVGGKIMTCTATGFPQLEYLRLSNLSGVMNLQVEEGAMPRIRALTMDKSLKRTLPERIRSLPGSEALNWDLENFY